MVYRLVVVPAGRHRGAVRHVRKLAAHRRQNQLDLALQELGRLERALFMLDWLEARNCADAAMPGSTRASSVISSRRGSHLQTRPANNAGLSTAVPRCLQFRASGLNLVIAAIVFWNATVRSKRT